MRKRIPNSAQPLDSARSPDSMQLADSTPFLHAVTCLCPTPRLRFAPSPSGRMHLGNVFSALLGWLSARKAGGEYLLRFEDLDERTSDPARAGFIVDDLAWLGIDFDGDPIYQSADPECYEEAFHALENRADLYPCFCSRADLHVASAPHASDGSVVYPGTCRGLTEEEIAERAARKAPAMRIRVPDTSIVFEDGHYGRVEQNLARECGDFVVRRSDGVFAYQFACVVDDAREGITEVVRGRDLLSSTPRQIYLQRVLGYKMPCYVHHPLLTDVQERRLSKRDVDLDMGRIRDCADTPEELIGHMAFLAGIIDVDAPVSLAELLEEFSWDKVRHKDICAYTSEPIS